MRRSLSPISLAAHATLAPTRARSGVQTRNRSGHFMGRIPPQVHRALALRAAAEKVNLNRLANAKFAA